LIGPEGAIADPRLADFAAVDGWWIEQMFSPSDRAAPRRAARVAGRAERPYLVSLSEDRTTVIGWGEQVTDAQGSYWRLASGAPVRDDLGVAIAPGP
jgi:hypothetical protein